MILQAYPKSEVPLKGAGIQYFGVGLLWLSMVPERATKLSIGIIVPNSCDIDPDSRASKGMSQIQLHSSFLKLVISIPHLWPKVVLLFLPELMTVVCA